MHHPPLRMMKTKQTNKSQIQKWKRTYWPLCKVSITAMGGSATPRPPLGRHDDGPHSVIWKVAAFYVSFSIFSIQYSICSISFLIAASFAFPNLYMICYRKLNLKSKKWVMMSCETFFLTYDFSKCETFCFFWKLI